jgi:hypothetical protein
MRQMLSFFHGDVGFPVHVALAQISLNPRN